MGVVSVLHWVLLCTHPGVSVVRLLEVALRERREAVMPPKYRWIPRATHESPPSPWSPSQLFPARAVHADESGRFVAAVGFNLQVL